MFEGTKGGGGEIRIYAMTDETTPGALETTLTLIGKSGPKEQDNGLMDLEASHIHLNEAYTTWAKAAAPYSPNASSEVYETEDGQDIGGSTSSAPLKLAIWIGPYDPDADKHLTLAWLFRLERGSRDHTTAKGKFNELTTKFKGQAPAGTVAVADTMYGAKVTGVAGNITTTNGSLEAWLDKA